MDGSDLGYLTNNHFVLRPDATEPLLTVDAERRVRFAIDRYLIVPKEFFTEEEFAQAEARWRARIMEAAGYVRIERNAVEIAGTATAHPLSYNEFTNREPRSR